MNSIPSTEYALGDMAFYWRMRQPGEEAHARIPAFLPFSFAFLSELQLVIQTRRDDTLHWLDEVYREDQNVGYLQEGHALATSYGDDFLEFIDRSCGEHGLTPESFIEVGCGGGYLLARLQKKGFQVKGVDPSPVSVRAAENLGVPMLADFYPSSRLVEKVDVMFHYDVLEHVADPVAFLAAHRTNLQTNGHVIIAVPDCTQSILCGDASMAIHEHLNYFDAESLGRTLSHAGFRPLTITPSGYGGVLYAIAQLESAPRAIGAMGNDVGQFSAFTRRLDIFRSVIREFVSRHASSPKGVGFYIPLRLMPYLATLDPILKMRFFDDDPGIHGKCFDGYDIPVEDFADFMADPPSCALIGSFPFGAQIAAKIRNVMGSQFEIVTLEEISTGRRSG